MKRDNTVVFVFSKPLQWVNILNLPVNYNSYSKRILLCIQNFGDADYFIDKLKQDTDLWQDLILVKSYYEAFIKVRKIRPDTIYSYIDYGVKGWFFSSSCKNFYLYEEGYTSYHQFVAETAIQKVTFGLKNFLFKLLRTGTHLGNNQSTRYFYLYNPHYYQQKFPESGHKAVFFKKSLMEHLRENEAFILSHFNPAFLEGLEDLKGLKIAMYITNHFYNEEIMSTVIEDKGYDLVILKPHPQLLRKFDEFQSTLPGNIKIIRSNILVEIIVEVLLKNGNQVSIYHESSTACLYLEESDSLRFYNFGKGNFRMNYDKMHQAYYPASSLQG